jgi:hypothetical protein
MSYAGKWSANLAGRLEKYRKRFEDDIFSADKRRNDIFLESYCYFIKIEDLL